jgi:drug/metabolite transporter (DMT)-like permease
VTQQAKGSWAIVAAACTWGTWRLWLTGPALDPAAQGALVLTIPGLLCGAMLARSAPRPAPRPRSAWAWMVAFGVLEAANYLLYFRALAAGDSAAAAVTHYLAPLLVAAAAPLLGEPLSRRVAFAAPVAFVGTLAMVGLGPPSDATTTAALFGAGSAVFYAANVLLAKRLSPHFSTLELLGLHNLMAAPLVWAFSRTPPWTAGARELALACAGAVLGGTLAALAYFWGLSRIAATRAAVLAYLEPVATGVVAAAFLGEPLTATRVVAMGVVLGAGLLVVSEPAAENAAIRASASSPGEA